MGAGFMLEKHEALEWITRDRKNAEVLHPFVTGDDLNSRSDLEAWRWVIDFNDRPEDVAREYDIPYSRVLQQVKPERARKANDVRDAAWWLFWRARPALRKAVAPLGEMLAINRHSKIVMPVRIKASYIPSEGTVVFATDSFSDQAILSSTPHQMWAMKYGSTLGTNTTRYTPSKVLETFPRPGPADRLAAVGRTLDTERRAIMLSRELGLTKLYNLVNDPDYADADIDRLRQIHVELDTAVMDAYGWSDVALDHGFHSYRQMERWTVSPTARVEILDRLLEENLRRSAAQGDALPPAEDEDEGDDE